MTIRFIDLRDAAKYREDGWTVTRMQGHHGIYWAIASRGAV